MSENREPSRLILFDLDGTIAESGSGIMRSIEAALRAQGIRSYTAKQLQACVGPPLRESFTGIFGLSEERAKKAVQDFRARYETVGIFELSVYDGIPQLLKRLKEAGFLLAVASSKPEQFVRQILARYQLDAYLPVVAGATMDESLVEKADIIRLSIRRAREQFPESRFSEEGIWMVGDRHYDVEGAKNAGLRCIGVTYGYGTRAELQTAGADEIFDTPSEVGDFLIGGGSNE